MRRRILFPACAVGLLALAVTISGCTKSDAPGETTRAAKHYAYSAWSDWELDCSARTADAARPCAAVRKRVCRVEGTGEGVGCDQCGGNCKEEVTHDGPPMYLYTAWSEWTNHCDSCSATPKPCKADRSRFCVNRATGQATDCEYCGGNCKEEEARMSSCSPESKWTTVHAYSDQACSVEIRGDTFAGQWGPQTNTPFNAGCSETQWNDKCVRFGAAYYKWEPCVRGCTPPFTK